MDYKMEAGSWLFDSNGRDERPRDHEILWSGPPEKTKSGLERPWQSEKVVDVGTEVGLSVPRLSTLRASSDRE